jgi:hypothetical protein
MSFGKYTLYSVYGTNANGTMPALGFALLFDKGSTKRTLCGIVLFKLNTFFSHVFTCP